MKKLVLDVQMDVSEFAVETALVKLDIDYPTLFLLKTNKYYMTEAVGIVNSMNTKLNIHGFYFHSILDNSLEESAWELVSTEHNKYVYSKGA